MADHDVQVHGAGIVGRCLALALAHGGLRVALNPGPGPRPDGAHRTADDDVRGYALNAASIALLRRLKVWDALPADAATPVLDMRVRGDAAAPGAEIAFSAWQQRVTALAWITDAAALERELAAAVRFAPNVDVVGPDAAVEAPLQALCDGRDSARRAALGVAFERIDYGQRAIAARLTAELPHRGIARQWFRSPDVLALLPFDRPAPGVSLALVWSLPEARAGELLALEPAAFEAALLDATGGAAGTLRLASPRAAWPLSLSRASSTAGAGWVLLGDAAHVVHPLAGQGLNLGLADVTALAEVLAGREAWRSLGDARLLRRYARARRAPTRAMSDTIDGLFHLFAAEAPGVRELRNRGLGLVDRLSPLKRWLAARALES